MEAKWKVAGISFDHMHMGDNLRMAHEHPQVEIVGICDADPARMKSAAERFQIPRQRVFTDWRECLERMKPDLVLLCPATGEHARWTRDVAPYRVHVIMEKPFAASLADADAMIAAMEESGRMLAINWPLRWSRPHATTRRLIDEGVIGEVREVHYYDGNRGPLWHLADKVTTSEEFVNAEKKSSWWYRRAMGGGSLLDYLGYGTTLGTWFHGGRSPLEITCMVDDSPDLEVDEHSVTVARYDCGLSKFETRWGTFSDPWVHQPQPRCGFTIVGSAGTIGCWDYQATVFVQTRKNPAGEEIPCDELRAPHQNPVQHVIHCLETGEPLTGPLSPEIARIGQQMIETAVASARAKKTLPLID